MSNKDTSIKSKLLKLKEWLTISETAKHLSIMFGEDVTEADVLRLGLDRHLTLSVNFVNYAKAKCGDKFLPVEEWDKSFKEIASWENARIMVNSQGLIVIYFDNFDLVFYQKEDDLVRNHGPWNPLGPDERLKSLYLKNLSVEKQRESLNAMIDGAIKFAHNQSKIFHGKVPPSIHCFKGDVITIKGIWNLPMLGAEKLDIEHQYQMLTNGPEITLSSLDGAFVEDEKGVIWQLQDTFDEEYIKAMNSEESKKKNLEFYADFLKKKISKNEIDEKEAENLLAERKKKLERPKAYDDKYYPSGGLPEDSVLVVRTEVLRDFMNRIASENSDRKTPKDIPILDSNHRFHAKELKIAFETWMELYEKNPFQNVPQGGHKKYITKWLETNYPTLGQRAKDRVSTIINPNPKGGASPTS
jgi:hypothetical protein